MGKTRQSISTRGTSPEVPCSSSSLNVNVNLNRRVTRSSLRPTISPGATLGRIDMATTNIVDSRIQRINRKKELEKMRQLVNPHVFDTETIDGIDRSTLVHAEKLEAIGWTDSHGYAVANESRGHRSVDEPFIQRNKMITPDYTMHGILGNGKGAVRGLPKHEFRSIYEYLIPHDSAKDHTPWKTCPFKPPPSLKIKILSVVASVSLGSKLDLGKIAANAYNLNYDPESFTPLVMRIKKPLATAMIFKSGKMVVTGTKSEKDCEVAAKKFARIIQKIGYRVAVKGMNVHNITATCNLGFRVRVHLLGADRQLSPLTAYHPELFTGVSIPLSCPRAKTMIFQTGSVLMTGIKREADLERIVEIIYPHVKLYAN